MIRTKAGLVHPDDIQQVEQWLALEVPVKVFKEDVGDPLVFAVAGAGRVRADHHVRKHPKRGVRGKRFIPENVERRPTEMAGLERIDQGGLVDEGATRHIDEDRARGEKCEFGRPYHPLRLGRVGSRQHEVLGADRNAWLDFLMSQVVIPGLPQDRLVAVHHYPAEQAALARLDPADNRFAERFEIFFRGLELANGYRELLDPAEQRRRFDQDRARRAAAGLEDMPTDGALLAALDHGLPDCCGVAVGFDRVTMSVGGIPNIAEAISFGR